MVILPWGEVILDVEGLPDLLWGLSYTSTSQEYKTTVCVHKLTLDHIGNCLAGDIKESLDVKVVGCQDQLKESSLINLHIKLVK